MTPRSSAVITISIGTVVSVAGGQQPSDALSVLRRSATAITDPIAVTFHSRKTGTGQLRGYIDSEADVKILRLLHGGTITVLVSGKFKVPGGSDRLINYTQDGTTARWLDTATNTIYEQPLDGSAIPEELTLAKEFFPEEYLAHEPFKAALDQSNLARLADESFDGNICAV